MKKTGNVMLIILISIMFACKKKSPPANPQTLITGKWLGKRGMSQADLYTDASITINADLSYTYEDHDGGGNTQNAAKGTLVLNNQILSGSFIFSKGVTGSAYVVFTLSNDYKKMDGYLTATPMGSPVNYYMTFSK